jgi:hypothetical protein
MAAIDPLVIADSHLVISPNMTWRIEDSDDHPRRQMIDWNPPSNDTNPLQQSQNLEHLRQLLRGMIVDQEKNFDSTTQAGHDLC